MTARKNASVDTKPAAGSSSDAEPTTADPGSGRFTGGVARCLRARRHSTCHSRVVAEAAGYISVSLTLKESGTVDEFYKYPGKKLPEVGEVIKVVRFMRDRPTRARVTDVDARAIQPRITAIQID